MDVSKLVVLILSIKAVENRSFVNGSSHEEISRTIRMEESERLISPTARKKVISSLYKDVSSTKQCMMKLNELKNEYYENVKMTNMSIDLVNVIRKEMSEKARTHNIEITLLKEKVQEQDHLVKILQKQAEEFGAKLKLRLVNGNSPREGRVEVYKDGVWGTVCDDNWDFKEANVVCLLRLRNGKSANEGFIEMSINGKWGGICDTGWNQNNAEVACRSLGYSGGLPISSSVFGEGNTQIWLGSINCRGHEDSLLECTQSAVGSSTCDNSNIAAVVCYDKGNGLIRLRNGKSANEGFIEVLINGKWGGVCDTGCNQNKAQVACRSLGYSGGVPISSSVFRKSNTRTWLDGINCRGHEDSLLECTQSVVGTSTCDDNKHSAVVCFNKGNDVVRIFNGSSAHEGRVQVLIDGSTLKLKEEHCSSSLPTERNCRVRIVDGSSSGEGLVEVSVNNRWRRVCYKRWYKNEVDVTCRGLGYSRGIPMSLKIFEEEKKETWFLDGMDCDGNEDSLLECAASRSTGCSNGLKLGVICYHAINDVTRIVNGSYPDEGLVEIFVNDRWRSVCINGWDKNDADVTCRSLGYLRGLPVSMPTFGGTENDNWFFDQMSCYGYEDSLLECTTSGSTSCYDGRGAGVICYRAVNNVTRTANGSSPGEGLVEVLVNDRWRSVCYNGWGINEADVTCRSLGYLGGFPVSSQPSSEDMEDMMMLGDINCNGNEDSILKCSQSVIRSSGCNGGKAGVVCYHIKNAYDTAVRKYRCKEKVKEIYALSVRNWENASAFGEPLANSMSCSGFERMPTHCTFFLINGGDCNTNGSVEIECFSGNIRLVNGASSNEGRVEVFFNGVWGTVCDDDWDDRDARVVCRSLGYSGDSTAHGNAYYQQGSGTIWFDNVDCQGTESSIFYCRHNFYGKHNCGHSEDAGVTCQ
ncbi:scavenger receptor cysteine-rich type 1 protein M130-like [Saccostrea echinata]|uniref:scavenger receptor cysteine-rich type 1 protein M130-like n=1 Tax=Saccostrea echinata TaxID=191078 RepID=UPI002A7F05C4|nr:scavenger receptor cysteine-rich type 1 protein M130-like [Saccostrea echinata]